MRLTRFSKISLLIWGIIDVIIAVALVFFWFFLSDYEKMRPDKNADSILALFNESDGESLLPLLTEKPSFATDGEILGHYLKKETGSDEIYYYELSSANDTVKRYSFVAGEKEFALLSVAPKEKPESIFGLTDYIIESFRLMPISEYTVTAPSDAVPVINGERSELTGKTVSSTSDSFFTEYTVSEYSTKDTVGFIESVSLADSALPYSVAVSEDGRSFTVTYDVSEAELAEMSEFATNFVNEYSLMTTVIRYPKEKVTVNVLPDSKMESVISKITTLYGITVKDVVYKDNYYGNAVRYSENDYSVNIGYVADFIKNSGRVTTYKIDATVYLTRTDGGLKVSYMTMKSE